MNLSPEVLSIIKQKQKQKEREHRKIGVVFILPALLFVAVFLLYPVLYNIVLAFYEWDMRLDPKFVGIDNFIEIFRGPEIPRVLINTLLWCTVGVVLPFIIALCIASFSQRLPGQEIFKTIFFLPRLLSGVSGAALWAIMLAPLGMINMILQGFGLDHLQKDWLIEDWVNTFALIFSSSWGGIGITIVLLLLGFAAIPKDPIEAAKIEGVSSWRIYWDILFPLLLPTCLIVILMLFIGSLSGFDFIWAMTRGGPYRTTETLAVTMYREGFLIRNFGIGAALALILSTIVLVMTFFMVKLQKKYQVRY